MNSFSRSFIKAFAIAACAASAGLTGCTHRSPVADQPPVSTAPASTPPAATAGAAAEPAEASPPPAPAPAAEGRAEGASHPRAKREADAPKDRPGLGTEWGETRVSEMTTVSFVRAEPSSPFATSSLFYNDAEGARAMAGSSGFRSVTARGLEGRGGAIAVGLRGEDGRFLNGFEANGREYAIGEAGQRYTIVIRNLTGNRLEAVVSVDGLDVIDGRPASFDKRGYIVAPHDELEVDGFRQNETHVAAFRFGSVRDSYASKKHGNTRNVGVIGVAVFQEQGSQNPLWTRTEIHRRQDADPFPARFATAPR